MPDARPGPDAHVGLEVRRRDGRARKGRSRVAGSCCGARAALGGATTLGSTRRGAGRSAIEYSRATPNGPAPEASAEAASATAATASATAAARPNNPATTPKAAPRASAPRQSRSTRTSPLTRWAMSTRTALGLWNSTCSATSVRTIDLVDGRVLGQDRAGAALADADLAAHRRAERAHLDRDAVRPGEPRSPPGRPGRRWHRPARSPPGGPRRHLPPPTSRPRGSRVPRRSRR